MIMDLEHIGNKCGFVDTGMLNKCSQLVGGDKDMVKVFKYKGLKINEHDFSRNILSNRHDGADSEDRLLPSP